MKKLTIKGLLIGALVLVFNQSCTNLDENLYDVVTPDNFFKTEEEFISALGAAYTNLYGLLNHGGYFSTQEVQSDEAMIPQRGADWYDGGYWLRAHRHENVPTDDNVNGAWNFLYGGVSSCNRLLEQFQGLVDAGSIDQAFAAPFLAELRALRALWYFWLLDSFGNVPLVTQFNVPQGFAPTNNTRAEVYAFVEKELVESSAQLPKTVDGSTYGRMHYYVAQALLAKLYLNAQVYTGTPQWEKAIAAADNVINSGVYSLEGDYFVNFNTENSGSKENIFVVPYDDIFAYGFQLPQMTLHYQSQATFNLQEQPWNGYCSLQEFYESYSDDDRRKGVWGNQKIRGNFLAGPQYKSDGKTPIIDVSADDADGPPIVFTPQINEHFPNCQRQAGVRVGKYEFRLGARQVISNDFPILRYADILLTKAEALWRKSQADGAALALVNQVRSRAGVAAFASLTADNLLAERGREMFYEGWRRQDLIRFDKFDSAKRFQPASAVTKRLWPIPFSQLDANKNLKQNPGY